MRAQEFEISPSPNAWTLNNHYGQIHTVRRVRESGEEISYTANESTTAEVFFTVLRVFNSTKRRKAIPALTRSFLDIHLFASF